MLRKKTLVIIGATLLGLVVLLYATFNATLLDGFLTVEKHDAEVNVNRLLSYLNSQSEYLALQIQDWSHWDDTYQFAEDLNEAYIENNIWSDTFVNLRIDLMMFVSDDGEALYSAAFDMDTGDEITVSPDVLSALAESPTLRPEVDGEAGVSGVMVVDGLPMFVASSQILDSNLAGPPHGRLLWGRFLDDEELARISDFMRAPVSVKLAGDAPLTADFAAAREHLTLEQPVYTSPVDSNVIAGYGLLGDVAGQPALLMRLDMPRNIYQQGLLSLEYFMLSLLAVGLVFAVVVTLLLERLVLARVFRLIDSVRGIASGSDAARIRLPAGDKDELGDLAREINTMLDALATSQSELQHLNLELEGRVHERTAELERQKGLLEAILDSMNEGVVYGTADRIDYVNRQMSLMTGYEEADFVGKEHKFLFASPVIAEKRGDKTDGRWVLRGERHVVCKDGTQLEVAYTILPLKGAEGDPKTITILRDVTEEKAQQARRDRFLAHAAHELRTPLTNLMTRLYLMRRQPGDVYTHLDVLDSVTAHMRSLVEDLLDVSRFRRGTIPLRRERLSLNDLIEHAVMLQVPEAAHKNILLNAHVPDTPVTVFADRKRIVQVLTNLIVNAINYTLRDGRVDVILTTDSEDRREYAVMRVRDNGVGVDSASLEHIFQPFFRVSQETVGTGLGLAIVKEIVEQHGGDVSVVSTPGQGSTFTVRLLALNEGVAMEDQPTDLGER